MLSGYRLFVFRAAALALQPIQFDLELFGGRFPLLGLLFPVITTSPGIIRPILIPFDLIFELLILGFPQFHTRFEPLRQFAQRRFVTVQTHFTTSL